MPIFRRAVATLIAALTIVGATAPLATAATPEHRAQKRQSYVALGDSYAAGLGAGTPKDACGRSSYGYPSLIAKVGRLDLTLAACSGATMADVFSSQLASVTPDADYVTVQVGGNDVGFAPVLLLCAQPDSDATCAAGVAQGRAYLEGDFAANATALFGAVRAQAPQAKLIVVGYPRLFNGKDCSPLVEFSAAEQSLINGTVAELNDQLAAAARRVGAKFANPASAFSGHAWCSRLPWVNGPVEPVVASFHPNVLGQLLGYAPVVGRYFLR